MYKLGQRLRRELREAAWLPLIFALVACCGLPGNVRGQEGSDHAKVSVENFVVLEVECIVPEAKLPEAGKEIEYPLPADHPETVAVLTQQKIRLAAVAVAPDTVVSRDPGLSPEAVGTITVTNAEGKTGRAELVGRYRDLPCLVFRLRGVQARPLPKAKTLPQEGAFLSQYLLVANEKWHLHGESSNPEPLWADPKTLVLGTGLSDSDLDLALVLFSHRRAVLPSPAVITRKGSLPLAIGPTSGFSLRDGELSGTVPIAVPSGDELVHAAAEPSIRERVEAAARAGTLPIRLQFRKATGAEEPPEDEEALGLLIGGYIFVPKAISRAQAALIDKVWIVLSDDRQIEGQFVGAFQNFDGYLVRPPIDLPGDVRAPAVSERELSLHELCVATNLHWAYGGRYFQTRFTRPVQHRVTFFGEADYLFSGAIGDGAAIWSVDGRLLGLVVQQRYAYQDLDELLPPPTPSVAIYLSRHRPGDAFLPAARFEQMIREVDKHLDPRVRVRKPGEELRRVWLGVEFTRVSEDLADALGCRRETRDGAIGLLVQLVYPGSPADRAGIKPGDVLLALSVPGYPTLIELTGRRRTTGNVRNIFERLMRARAMGGRRRPTGPWPSRQNYLTELLGILGEGQPVRIIYWRNGKVSSVATTLELAPPDQDSAPQYEDTALGLTVKDLTYEVRAALRLASDAPGVVVAKVESGSPAAQARLRVGEIIVAVQDNEVLSVDEFRKAIEEAREAGDTAVRLRVMERGRSRFVDMELQ